MNLTTLEISPDEAKERLVEYEASLRHDRNAEDEAIAAGYRAAARGLPIIQLSKVIAAGGVFGNGLPRLAVIRADATECWCSVERASFGGQTTAFTFYDDPIARNLGALVGAHSVRVTADIVSPASSFNRWRRGHTIVPSIPPRHRPNRTRIHTRHILWEVEEWSMVVPKDPALLRHIRGDLWVVLSTWDLTDLERAVLGARSS